MSKKRERRNQILITRPTQKYSLHPKWSQSVSTFIFKIKTHKSNEVNRNDNNKKITQKIVCFEILFFLSVTWLFSVTWRHLLKSAKDTLFSWLFVDVVVVYGRRAHKQKYFWVWLLYVYLIFSHFRQLFSSNEFNYTLTHNGTRTQTPSDTSQSMNKSETTVNYRYAYCRLL